MFSWKKIIGRPNDARFYSLEVYEHLLRYAPYDIGPVGKGQTSLDIGDFGILDPTTLQFVKKGNIIDINELNGHEQMKQDLQNVLKGREENTERFNKFVFCDGKDMSSDGSIQLKKEEIPSANDYDVYGGWSLTNDPLVSLILVAPTFVSLRYPGRLGELLKTLQSEKIFSLGKNVIIYSLVKCKSFARFHSWGSKGKAYYLYKGVGGNTTEVLDSSSSSTPNQTNLSAKTPSWVVHPVDDKNDRWSYGVSQEGEQYAALIELRRLSNKGNGQKLASIVM